MRKVIFVSRMTSTIFILLFSALQIGGSSVCASADPVNSEWLPATAVVSGQLSQVDRIPVLHLWGTPREQGYAHGYLLGPEIIALLDRIIGYRIWGLTAVQWDGDVLAAADRFRIVPEYLSELKGMLEGIEARAGGLADVPALGRALQLADLIAMTYVYDAKRLGCSSLVVWGSMTADAQVLVGRNMDWPVYQAFIETQQIVVVRAAWPDSERVASVSVFWPGILGIATGMNANGIVLLNNDAYNERDPEQDGGFYPFLLSNRTALESASAQSSAEDIAAALRAEPSGVGRCVTVSLPANSEQPRGLVFECDAIWSESGGLVVRTPNADESFVLTTNHHRLRGEPIPCAYYDIGESVLQSVALGATSSMTVATTWDLLTCLITPGLTYHSVVFESDTMLMHLRLQENGTTAQHSRMVTFDVASLLRELPESP